MAARRSESSRLPRCSAAFRCDRLGWFQRLNGDGRLRRARWSRAGGSPATSRAGGDGRGGARRRHQLLRYLRRRRGILRGSTAGGRTGRGGVTGSRWCGSRRCRNDHRLEVEPHGARRLLPRQLHGAGKDGDRAQSEMNRQRACERRYHPPQRSARSRTAERQRRHALEFDCPR